MNKLIKYLIAISFVFSSSVAAHVSLKSSTPADNAMLMEAPQTLSLEFSKNVKIVKLSLENNQGEKIKFGFKPTKEAGTDFSWDLPELAPANYSIEMIFIGKDGHKMKDSIRFMIH